MNKQSTLPAIDDEEMDRFSAELAIAAYHVALREAKPKCWLDLELGLWNAIRARLAVQTASDHPFVFPT